LSTLDTTSATTASALFLNTPALVAPNASEQTQLANVGAGSPNGLDYVNTGSPPCQ